MFQDNLKEEKDNYFFIKVILDEKYITFLVYSYVSHNDFRKLISLINNIPEMWFGWIGSKFLENFDIFCNELYPNFKTELIKFTSESRDLIHKKKKGSAIDIESRTREELNKIRELHYKEFNELFYLKRAQYRFTSPTINFSLTISTKTEFTLKGNGLFEFLSLFKEIINYAQVLRDSFTKNIIIKSQKRSINKTKEPIEKISIDKIELIDINMKNPTYDSWYNNLIDTFSVGYIDEYNIVSFVLEKGNPYFMVEILDLECESRLFLSAIKSSIKISPSNQTTKPSTISKLFSILQSQVDPSIEMSL